MFDRLLRLPSQFLKRFTTGDLTDRVLGIQTIRQTLSGTTVQSLLGALPGMGSVVLLLGLIFYVSAVIATDLFGQAFPEYFGTLGRSLYSLFQVMTL